MQATTSPDRASSQGKTAPNEPFAASMLAIPLVKSPKNAACKVRRGLVSGPPNKTSLARGQSRGGIARFQDEGVGASQRNALRAFNSSRSKGLPSRRPPPACLTEPPAILGFDLAWTASIPDWLYRTTLRIRSKLRLEEPLSILHLRTNIYEIY
ncbi:hypothetical protein BO70DRAFT_430576 [Aspergillus heteromorphus CBS 117.55]|uniref:Uncharacterized protein n=1 Tax=Aspergillus heteromorphus CBS 117.55 TaxID=1448321 RepID=A0A317VYT9_9EURO|nr:uncharacterized protein BO70DRAFT_430576 [Aspergillus heteromorphus CBS 117.55]PWY77060.1 hypothetical protein BO70DRAFT_430576 [Aspergillus heteromorphus CBS 117.55]